MFDFDELDEVSPPEAFTFYAISDVHVEIHKNLDWLRGLPSFPNSAVIVAGDLAITVPQLREALLLFKERFNHVFYCYGNHEMWCSEGKVAPADGQSAADSHGKLRRIRELCAEINVHTSTQLVGGVWVVPILGWYHHSWDQEGPLQPPPGKTLVREPQVPELLASDSAGCRWATGLKNGSEALAEMLDRENEAWGSWPLPPGLVLDACRPPGERVHPIISFSHFLPRQELMPEKRFLFQPNLPKIVGSDFIRRRVEQIRPDLHIFGHTHFPWDMTLDGTRYRSWPLGSPNEQARRICSYPSELVESWHPMPVMTALGTQTPKHEVCWFSEMYTKIRREPDSCHMASYVAMMYCPEAPIVPGEVISTDREPEDEAAVLRRAKYRDIAHGSMRRETGKAKTANLAT